MFGLVGTENLGGSQGVGEGLEGFYHMGKNAKSRMVPRYENPQIFIELHLKKISPQNHKVFDKNQIKILECHNTYPLGKISSPRFQLILT